MQYTLNRQEKGKVEVKVDVPQAAFDETYGQVLAQFKKETKVAGFRPGTAPDDVIEGQVGYNKILNETASFLVSKHLSEIFKKEEITPLNTPQIAVDTLAKGSSFAFTATFTQKPAIKVGDWKKVKVPKIKSKEITDEDINKSIVNIYEAWKKSQKSNAGEDAADKEEGKFIYDAKGNKIPLKEEGKNKVTAAKIDDEFAKKIGARDLAHLRELVKKDLETLVVDQVEMDFEQKVFEEIAKLVEVEVPEVLIDDELNRILMRLGTELERQSKTLEDFLKEEKTTIEDLKNKWREQAEKNVKISMAMDEIGKDEKIQVTKEELESALAGVNQTNMSSQQKRDLENYLIVSIFQAKTLTHIKATLSESKPKEEEKKADKAPRQ